MKKMTFDIGLIGRILFALPFGIIGLNHFLMVDFYTGMLTSFVPGGGYSIVMTGFCLIAASLSIIFKKYIQLSCWLLAALLLIFILTIHIPQLFDPQFRQSEVIMQLLKDTSLMGGALMIAAMFKPETQESK